MSHYNNNQKNENNREIEDVHENDTINKESEINFIDKIKTWLKKYSQVVIWVIVIIAVILLIVLTPSKDDNKDKITITTEDDSTIVVDENTELGAGDFQKMTAFEDGDYTYIFDSIDWKFNFNNTSKETKVGFFFKDFSRYGTTPYVHFYRPFGVGTFNGKCEEKGILIPESTGRLLSSLVCENGGKKIEIAMFQDSQNGKLIHIKRKDDNSNSGFNIIRTIDISTIVK